MLYPRRRSKQQGGNDDDSNLPRHPVGVLMFVSMRMLVFVMMCHIAMFFSHCKSSTSFLQVICKVSLSPRTMRATPLHHILRLLGYKARRQRHGRYHHTSKTVCSMASRTGQMDMPVRVVMLLTTAHAVFRHA